MISPLKALGLVNTREHQFLQNLVQYGGACTVIAGAKSIGILNRENARKRIKRLEKMGLLVSKDYSKLITNGPIVYYPSRTIGIYFGCDRRVAKDIEEVVERCYRFYISTFVSNEDTINYLSKNARSVLSTEILGVVARANRDESYNWKSNTIFVPVLPYWSPTATRNRIMFWLKNVSKANVEVWTPNVVLASKATANIPPELRKRITGIKEKFDNFVTAFQAFEAINLARMGVVDADISDENEAE